jgi:hypothetical protein
VSIILTKNQLNLSLSDPNNKVIALTGKWGTGKTYLWNEYKKKSKDKMISESLYVSLFGLNTVDQIKQKIVQGFIPKIDEHSSTIENIGQNTKKIASALGRFSEKIDVVNGIFSGISGIGIHLLFQHIASKKLIVIDDIERKNSNLNIDEILGFIDDLTQNYGSRFILILNSDKLNDKHVWDTLREKVIDQEIILTPTTEEAFNIALMPFGKVMYKDSILKYMLTCKLINIRVIRKIIKKFIEILEKHTDLSEPVLKRVAPSIILLSAIHYQGLENGPSFEYVLDHNYDNFINKTVNKMQKDPKDIEIVDDRVAKWNLLLKDLEILYVDEFERLIVDYLQTGIIQIEDIRNIIEYHKNRVESIIAREESILFMSRCFWDHQASDEDLLSMGKKLTAKSEYLDAVTVSALSVAISKLKDGEETANQIINAWLETYAPQINNGLAIDMMSAADLHPKIIEAIDNRQKEAQRKMTAYEACIFVLTNNGWGQMQENSLKNATIQEMEDTILTKTHTELKPFMLEMIELSKHTENYERHFGHAMKNFIEACSNLYHNKSTAPRLKNLIKLLFEESKCQRLIDAVNESSNI